MYTLDTAGGEIQRLSLSHGEGGTLLYMLTGHMTKHLSDIEPIPSQVS